MKSSAVKKIFEQFDPKKPIPLEGVYSDQCVFQDPFHRIQGRKAVEEYLFRLNQNLNFCKFEFSDQIEGGDSAALVWLMSAELRMPKRRKIFLEGVTHLKFDSNSGLVILHKDYYDAGEMLYEQIPALKSVIQAIKARVGN